MAHDVFISYSSTDKTAADAVCHRMEAAGIRCWIAPRDVAAGSRWDDAVAEAITAAKVLVVIFSAAANASSRVVDEVVAALEAGATVIPFRIENIAPTGAMFLRIGRRHWVDALTPPLEAHIDQLIDGAKRNLVEAARTAPKGPLGSSPSASDPRLARVPLTAWRLPVPLSRLLIAVAILTSVAVVILMVIFKGTVSAPSKVPGDQQVAREPAASAPPARPSTASQPARPPEPKSEPPQTVGHEQRVALGGSTSVSIPELLARPLGSVSRAGRLSPDVGSAVASAPSLNPSPFPPKGNPPSSTLTPASGPPAVSSSPGPNGPASPGMAPSEQKNAFLGVWTGKWNNRSNLQGSLIVKKIYGNRVEADYRYGWGNTLNSLMNLSGFFVGNDAVQFTNADGTRFEFRRAGNTLEARYYSNSGNLSALFTRSANVSNR